MTTILMIRHADNDLIGKRLAGRLPNIHLNQHGQEQAKSLAQYLSHLPISQIYCSPLERTYETGLPLSKALSIPVIKNDAFIEIDYGDWQGKIIKDLYKLPEWKELMSNAEGFKFPRGESLIDAQKRSITEVLNITKDRPKEDMIACITHGDIIRLSLSYFLNMRFNDYHRFEIHTASISAITLTNEIPQISRINLQPIEKLQI